MKNKKTFKEKFYRRSSFDAPVEELFRWHARPGALERLSPPWDPVRVVTKEGGIDDGGTVNLKLKGGPFLINWSAKHGDYIENMLFRDIQVKGPFAEWIHSHHFIPDGAGRSILEDRIDFRFPIHGITALFFKGMVLQRLERIFRYRHDITAGDLKSHGMLHGKKKRPMKIAVSGSRGVIGSALVPFLLTGGHDVLSIVRVKSGRDDEIFWDPESGRIDKEKLKGVDAIIHLAGEPIGRGFWTRKKKKKIIDSRVMGTRLLADAMAGMKNGPGILICASAVGFYGNRGDRTLTEKDTPGDDFISTVCREWEDAAGSAQSGGIRTVFLRLGVVLTPAGGALQRLFLPFILGLGGRIGSGRQYMSWVGIDDVLDTINFILFDKKIHGPVNVTSPNPLTNGDFTRILSGVMNRPAWFAIPELAVKILFGRMGREVLLSSARVMPEKLLNAGYEFRHEKAGDALEHLLGLRN